MTNSAGYLSTDKKAVITAAGIFLMQAMAFVVIGSLVLTRRFRSLSKKPLGDSNCQYTTLTHDSEKNLDGAVG